MADVALDAQNENPKELYGQGVRSFVLQDYDSAVRCFSKASELIAAEYGDDLHDSLGDVYLYYGKSLLELYRKESGPLGEAVLKNVNDESDEDIEASDGENDKEEPKEEEAKSKGEDKATEEVEEKPEEAVPDTSKGEGEPGPSVEAVEPVEEELTDLQVAWEVLELSKQIFTKRSTDGKKNLAETLIVLGEVSLESGNFASAIEDMTEGLQIQKGVFASDSRTVAETFYKLGGAYSTNGQIEESITSFQSSYDYLNNRIATLGKDPVNKQNTDEIEELKGLVPEIQEKIADMKNLKIEVVNKVTSAVAETVKPTNGVAEASSSKKATDISHLVKRKRRSDDTEANPAKKPSP